MNRPILARATIAAAAIAMLILAAPSAASAHVQVNPDRAPSGSYATLTFKVPTESATAGTVKLQVDLPTDTPFGSVSYQPIAGWKTEVVTEKLAQPITTDDGTITEAPVRVIWTADPGVQIAPGQFQEFVISAGAVPDTGSILLPTHQTYSDGSVVDWAEPTPASGKEPEHPAPILYVKDSPPAEMNPVGAPTVTTAATSAPPASATGTGAAVAIGLGIGGLALSAIALVVAVFAYTRRGDVPTPTGK